MLYILFLFIFYLRFLFFLCFLRLNINNLIELGREYFFGNFKNIIFYNLE